MWENFPIPLNIIDDDELRLFSHCTHAHTHTHVNDVLIVLKMLAVASTAHTFY